MFGAILKLLGLRSPKRSTPPLIASQHVRPTAIVAVSHERRIVQSSAEKVPLSKGENLLKQAVQQKKEKRYDDACATLREAFALGSGKASLVHRMRLPSYLLLAGKRDEAWRCLNEMNLEFIDPPSQSAIASKMADILQKEGSFRDALVQECWSLAMDVYYRQQFVNGCIQMADSEAKVSETDEFAWLDKGRTVHGKTPSGNPIYDCSYPSFNKGLKAKLTIETVKSLASPLIAKFSEQKSITPFSRDFLTLLQSGNRPEFVKIRELVRSL